MQAREYAAKSKGRSRASLTPTVFKVTKYKMKPPSSLKFRFRTMNDGQIRRWRSGKRHNAHLKSKAAKRGLLYHEVQEGRGSAPCTVPTLSRKASISPSSILLHLPPILTNKSARSWCKAGSSHLSKKPWEVWDLEVVSLDAPAQDESNYDPTNQENAFICHLKDHWFCIRKINRERYTFNSLYSTFSL
jgi:ribosomal protein L35